MEEPCNLETEFHRKGTACAKALGQEQGQVCLRNMKVARVFAAKYSRQRYKQIEFERSQKLAWLRSCKLL